MDPCGFTARESPGYLLRRAQQLLNPRVEALFAERELTLTQWIALKLLRDHMVSTGAELARHLGHNSGATTRLIAQLEARGFLQRRRRDDDRRLVALELTEAGKAAVAAMTPVVAGLWRTLLADFSNDEAATMVALLRRLVDRLEAEG